MPASSAKARAHSARRSSCTVKFRLANVAGALQPYLHVLSAHHEFEAHHTVTTGTIGLSSSRWQPHPSRHGLTRRHRLRTARVYLRSARVLGIVFTCVGIIHATLTIDISAAILQRSITLQQSGPVKAASAVTRNTHHRF